MCLAIHTTMISQFAATFYDVWNQEIHRSAKNAIKKKWKRIEVRRKNEYTWKAIKTLWRQSQNCRPMYPVTDWEENAKKKHKRVLCLACLQKMWKWTIDSIFEHVVWQLRDATWWNKSRGIEKENRIKAKWSICRFTYRCLVTTSLSSRPCHSPKFPVNETSPSDSWSSPSVRATGGVYKGQGRIPGGLLNHLYKAFLVKARPTINNGLSPLRIHNWRHTTLEPTNRSNVAMQRKSILPNDYLLALEVGMPHICRTYKRNAYYGTKRCLVHRSL